MVVVVVVVVVVVAADGGAGDVHAVAGDVHAVVGLHTRACREASSRLRETSRQHQMEFPERKKTKNTRNNKNVEIRDFSPTVPTPMCDAYFVMTPPAWCMLLHMV